MTDPELIPPGRARSLDVGGTPVAILATAGQTRALVSLTEHRLPPGAPGAPPHYHRRMTELFYIVSGRILLTAGASRQLAEAGTCMIVPPDAVHAFGNPTGEPATLLVISTPNPGREHYFEQLAEELRNQAGPRREVIEKLASEFDQYPAPGS